VARLAQLVGHARCALARRPPDQRVGSHSGPLRGQAVLHVAARRRARPDHALIPYLPYGAARAQAHAPAALSGPRGRPIRLDGCVQPRCRRRRELGRRPCGTLDEGRLPKRDTRAEGANGGERPRRACDAAQHTRLCHALRDGPL
jgi:hypothetical protein